MINSEKLLASAGAPADGGQWFTVELVPGCSAIETAQKKALGVTGGNDEFRLTEAQRSKLQRGLRELEGLGIGETVTECVLTRTR